MQSSIRIAFALAVLGFVAACAPKAPEPVYAPEPVQPEPAAGPDPLQRSGP